MSGRQRERQTEIEEQDTQRRNTEKEQTERDQNIKQRMNVIRRKERQKEAIRFKRYRGKRKKNSERHRKKVRGRQKK